MTTHGRTCSSSSETSACSGCDCTGSRSPAIAASTEVWPAAASATFSARIGPREVCTPVTRPPSTSIPVTAQSWMMSTPSASARARVAPGDVVVLGDPAARLVGRAEHRVAHVRRRLDDRADLLDAGRVEPLRVDAVEPVRLDPPHALADVVEVVREVEHAALGEEDVVAELLRQPLPELERVLVDRRALVPEVVGADDRRVAAHVAAADPAALEHRDVRHPVARREVVRGRQPVAAAADDHRLVGPPGVGRAPEEVGVLLLHAQNAGVAIGSSPSSIRRRAT